MTAEKAFEDMTNLYDYDNQSGTAASGDAGSTPPNRINNGTIFNLRVQSVLLELRAIKILKQSIMYAQSMWPTTIDDDTTELQKLQDEENNAYIKAAATVTSKKVVETGDTDGEKWKMISAITYRLTRKHIAEAVLEKVEVVEAYLRALVAMDKIKSVTASVTATLTTNSIFTHDSNNDISEIPSIPTVTRNDNQLSPSRALLLDMQKIDIYYGGSNQAPSAESPYVSTGSNTSFRRNVAAASSNSHQSPSEIKLRSYLQSITNEGLCM